MPKESKEQIKKHILSVLKIGDRLAGSSYEPKGIADVVNLLYHTNLTEHRVESLLDHMWRRENVGLSRFPNDSNRHWRGYRYQLNCCLERKLEIEPPRVE